MDLTGGNTSPGSGSMAGRTGDRGEGSTEAGSQRPECGRAGEQRSRRPGSVRTAGRGAHSAKSRLVRLRGPAENVKVCFMSGAQTPYHTVLPEVQNGTDYFIKCQIDSKSSELREMYYLF